MAVKNGSLKMGVKKAFDSNKNGRLVLRLTIGDQLDSSGFATASIS